MTDRPLDKTTQTYVTGENEALVGFFQDLKRGLQSLSLTTTRDPKGNQVVTGARRKSPNYLEHVFGMDFLIEHERTLEELQIMRTQGMMLSPFPKTMKAERVQGSGIQEAAAQIDSIKRKFDAWFLFCDTNHKHARAATILVFGDGHSFLDAAKVMRSNGLRANHRTMEGQCRMGVELYEQLARRV